MKSSSQHRAALGAVAWLFLKLGLTAFGGPAAHIAMMEEEVVRRRRWLSHEEFLDLLGATQLIPGPNSTELAIHIGHRRAGWLGLVVAGICFVSPAMVLVLGFAWAYVQFGQLPQMEGLLYGIKPVIMAIILQALWRLGGSALKKRWFALLGIAAGLAHWLGTHELLVLLACGAVAALAASAHLGKPTKGATVFGIVPWWTLALAGPMSTSVAPFGLWPMFLFFLKVGSVLFGSGYVLLAFLRADLVERWGWLTESQLLDAVAVGQFTPGPLFTTATFIGYLLGGTGGALLATLGIFLPAFVFVAISGPLIPRLRASPTAGAILDGVNVASLALMTTVTLQLGRAALTDGRTVLLAVVSAVLLFRYRVPSMWLVLTGAGVGILSTLL